MPNWVHNEVYLKGPQKDYIFKNILNEGKVDFNDIIPMPSEIFTGPLGLDEEKEYGEKNWYDWSRQYWGTKWNAQSTGSLNSECGVRFDTAWSMPKPIYQELSRRFPDMSFCVLFADEDFGSNCGIVEYKNGTGQDVSFSNELGISDELCDYFLATYLWEASVDDVTEYHEFEGMEIEEVKRKFNEYCEMLKKYLCSTKEEE